MAGTVSCATDGTVRPPVVVDELALTHECARRSSSRRRCRDDRGRSRRRPRERPSPGRPSLVIIATPRTLPDELAELPHVLTDPADALSVESVQAAVNGVHAELARRLEGRSQSDVEIVLVVSELAELDPGVMGPIASIAAGGQRHGIRLLAATARPVSELLAKCAFLDDFATRIVRGTADEDESVALLGAPGAEELASGGHVLVRQGERRYRAGSIACLATISRGSCV